jgi:hypothetical protein
MRQRGVQNLLMGGQACVLYGGAEFSRDVDLAVMMEPKNLARLREVLRDLDAECIAVPPFEARFLDMGLAVHFRCRHAETKDMRIDIMSRMRGVSPFSQLWDRRTTLEIDGEAIDVLSLPDLVQAKKTQRDKDWPMISRLLEAHYFQNKAEAAALQVFFWFREMRTASLLVDLGQNFPAECEHVLPQRSLLAFAKEGDESALAHALKEEETREREADRQYWLPLKRELERLRIAARGNKN